MGFRIGELVPAEIIILSIKIAFQVTSSLSESILGVVNPQHFLMVDSLTHNV